MRNELNCGPTNRNFKQHYMKATLHEIESINVWKEILI
jgi:hypothetical protein